MSRSHKAIAYFAVFHVGMGVGLLLGPHGIRVADHAILYDLIPTVWRGGLWLAAGILAVVVSLRSLRWGWVLLSLMPAQRLAGHAYSTYAWLVPGAPGGLSSSIADVFIWAAVLLLIRHLAGWPDLPPDRMGEKQRA